MLSTIDTSQMRSPETSVQNDGALDETDPNGLTVVSTPTASDRDVDTTVEQTCEKIKLTANNVRSIIRVRI